MRGVWVSYLDWNGWAKDEAGYKKAMDETLDLCVQKGLNAVFLQVRPDGDAMYPSQYFPWSKFASGKQGKNPGYDPLAYAVQAAHQRGLQLHAWINRGLTGSCLRHGAEPGSPGHIWLRM